MINVDKATKLLKKFAPTAKKYEYVCLEKSVGRVLGETIRSKIDVPEHNNSAVDGYGFNFNDYSKFKKLEIIGQSMPGKPFLGNIKSGQAIKVFTGALIINKTNNKLPIDTIIMNEKVLLCKNMLTLNEKVKLGQNMRLKGEDILKKQVIFKKGRKIRCVDLGYLASVGIKRLKVLKKLKIGIFSSGNEINLSSKKKNT